MNTYEFNNINTVSSAKAIHDYIVQTDLINSPHSLKFITLSVDDFPIEDLDWALELSNRSFNNLLDRKFTKKAIRQSLRVLRKSPPDIYRQMKGWIWSLHGKAVKDVITGGWRKTELERDARNNSIYNLHIHLLCECKFIPQPILSVLWKSVVTKDWQGRRCHSEGIVHVQDVGNSEEDFTKVINYMAKPIPIARTDRFRNLRLYTTFGGWYNRN